MHLSIELEIEQWVGNRIFFSKYSPGFYKNLCTGFSSLLLTIQMVDACKNLIKV